MDAGLQSPHASSHEKKANQNVRTPNRSAAPPKAERGLRTLTEMVVCPLEDARMTRAFWPETLNAALVILDQLPSARDRTQSRPQRWDPTAVPIVTGLHIFGTTCFALNRMHEKHASKAIPALYLGPAEAWGKKGHRVLDTRTGGPVYSRDVRFIEYRPPPSRSLQHGSNDQQAWPCPQPVCPIMSLGPPGLPRLVGESQPPRPRARLDAEDYDPSTAGLTSAESMPLRPSPSSMPRPVAPAKASAASGSILSTLAAPESCFFLLALLLIGRRKSDAIARCSRH